MSTGRGKYATRAMLELSLSYDKGPTVEASAVARRAGNAAPIPTFHISASQRTPK